ncbi:MAG TPA: M23 family metallopeptidase [Candidatus Aphodomonas merdavium]|nr:M23 family metallopeptidase [Candidatus Aphodomonas merdavium]
MNERWEKARFFISIAVSLGVIVASSLWAYALREKETAAASIQQAEQPGPQLACSPVQGETLRAFSAFSWDETLACYGAHEAVDLTAEEGEPVLAVSDGTVTAVRRDRLWGGMVEIQAKDGALLQYASLAWPAAVAAGDVVTAGTAIGYAGTAPCEAALGPHVHFAYLREGQNICPPF